MITLLQTQGQGEWLTQSDKLIILSVWGVLAIISANILLSVWKEETKPYGLTLLSYFGAWTFGTLMAPVIVPLSLLGWMGTITPKDAKNKILTVYNTVKEATIGHWRLGKAKQAPPQFTTGTNSGILVHPNPPSTSTMGPYLNDLLNVPTYKTASLQSGTFSAPPPPGPHPNHVNAAGIPHPNFGRGRRNGPNAMTRLSNGSGIVAKKAAPKM